MKNVQSLSSRGRMNDAFAELGMALHAVMDSTSPAHRGFQMWGGVPHAIAGGYINKHGDMPGSVEDLTDAYPFKDETVNLMRRAIHGDVPGCGCE